MRDKRKHSRLLIEGRTILELESSAMDHADPSVLITCCSLNISRKGLQAELEQEVLVGAILQFAVDLPDPEQTLFLVGEVIWCQPGEKPEGTWLAGFQILNAAGSDIEHWIAMIEELESSQ